MRPLALIGLLVLCGFLRAETAGRANGADLSRYRADVMKAVSAYKNYYPKEARQKKLQGKAVVALDVPADGAVSCALKASTGHEVLDRQAVGIACAAARTVAIPVGLKGTAFSLDVPIAFALPRTSDLPPGRKDPQAGPAVPQNVKPQQ